MDAGRGERIRDFFAIATACGQDGVYCAMIGQGFQSAFVDLISDPQSNPQNARSYEFGSYVGLWLPTENAIVPAKDGTFFMNQCLLQL